MNAGSSERAMENSVLIGRGGLLQVALRATAIPRNLVEIYQKGRKTRRFRSFRTTDMLICDSRSTTIDKRYLSMVITLTVSHTI